MAERILQLIESILTKSSSTHFNFISKLIVFISAIISANIIYAYFYGSITFEFTFRFLLLSIFRPATIAWLIFFILFYFVFYPTFIFMIILIYRSINPTSRKLSETSYNTAKETFGSSGIYELVKMIPAKKAKRLYPEFYIDILNSEQNLLLSLSGLLGVILQFYIFNSYRIGLVNNIGYFLFAVGLLLIIIIFIILPPFFRLFRQVAVDKFEEVNKIESEAINTSADRKAEV